MAKTIGQYTGQDVFLANQAGRNKPKPKPKGPDNQPTIKQIVAFYEAGHKMVLADWVRTNYLNPNTRSQVQDVLDIALKENFCTLADALVYITTNIKKD